MSKVPPIALTSSLQRHVKSLAKRQRHVGQVRAQIDIHHRLKQMLGNRSLERMGNGPGDAGDGIAVAADADGQANGAFKIA